MRFEPSPLSLNVSLQALAAKKRGEEALCEFFFPVRLSLLQVIQAEEEIRSAGVLQGVEQASQTLQLNLKLSFCEVKALRGLQWTHRELLRNIIRFYCLSTF